MTWLRWMLCKCMQAARPTPATKPASLAEHRRLTIDAEARRQTEIEARLEILEEQVRLRRGSR